MLLPRKVPAFDLQLAALLTGVVLSTVDSSALNLALPSLAVHFASDAGKIQGTASLYLIGSGLAFLPLAGLAARIGTVKVYRTSLFSFSLISLLLAFAPTLPVLLALRFLQGVAGAGIVGLVPGLAASIFKERQGWALGMISAAVAAGTLLGPALGGVMVDAFGWRSIFLINLPFGVLALLLSGGLTELKGVGLTESVRRALGTPRFLLALLATIFFFAQTFGVVVLWPFYFQAGGMSATKMGMLLLVPPVMLFFVGPWAGKLSDRKGFDRVCWWGSIILALSCCVQGFTGTILPGLIGVGVGRGVFLAANNAAVLGQAPPNTEAAASAFLSIARVTGQALGSMVAGTLWAGLAHRGSHYAYLITNLALAGLVLTAGVMIAGRINIAGREDCEVNEDGSIIS
ncbi:MAG: MFS transporter [Desulfuromonadaceae bacterium]|nr:MFS transporter [Desulfuromonadaceae bacterium]